MSDQPLEFRTHGAAARRLSGRPPLEVVSNGDGPVVVPRPSIQPDEAPDISHTDVGLGERFASAYGDRFRFVPGRRNGQGEWFHYDGNRWQPCGEVIVDQWIARMGRTLLQEAAKVAGKDDRERLWKLGNRALSTAGINAIRARVAAAPGIVTDADAFDTHPHLLSVANGVVDLRTRQLRKAEPALMLSRGSDIRYNPDAEAPTWARFLLEVFNGDQEAASRYEADAGYSLTGESREHVFFVDYGPSSRNGKTVAAETIKHVFGPRLCVTSQPGTFIRGRHEDPKRTRGDILRWRGARMIQTSELPENANLDEDLIKRLSGADTITARDIFQTEEEFTNTGKLWMRTNHFPALDPDSEAVWNRVRLHSFEVSFAGREDKNLPAKLRSEAEGILRRLIDRAHHYYQQGQLAPDDTAKAAELRAANDQLGEILARRFERDLDAFTPKHRLKEILNEEYKEAGERPPAYGAGFDERMARKGHPAGIRKVNGKTTRGYHGLTIRGDQPAP